MKCVHSLSRAPGHPHPSRDAQARGTKDTLFPKVIITFAST
jgi:hypothetical protein